MENSIDQHPSKAVNRQPRAKEIASIRPNAIIKIRPDHLVYPSAYSEEDKNMFMDNNCFWEWEYTDNSKIEETNALRSNDKCYPLNIQDNLTVGKDIIKNLKRIRKEHKKYSV